MTINTILVEDEPLSRIFLKNLLAEYCPSINIIATPSTEEEAVNAIRTLEPDLVLMDIELQQGNGFSVLQQTRQSNYDIIFTTALDYTGIRAIRFSGVNYLQKPIDIDSLQNAVKKIISNKQDFKTAVEHLLVTLDNSNQPSDLFLNTDNGPAFIKLSSLLFIRMQENNCIFHTEKEIHAVKNSNLKEYEQLLSDMGFFRPHSDYIVQLEKVAADSTTENGFVKMINDTPVPVSPKKQEQLDALLLSRA